MLKKLKNNSSWLLLSVIFIAGLVSRLNIVSKYSFWYDEAFSGLLVKQDIPTILKIIYEDRVHPPIYYLLLKLWSLIFGNTDTTLRMFSVIFGMALIVVAFILIKKLLNTGAAIAAAGIFALSPYFILYSLEARSYIMLGLEALVAIYLFVKLYSQNIKGVKELIKIKEFKILLGITILILLTHYLGLALIGIMGILLLIKLYPKTEKFIWAVLTIILVIILARGMLNGGDYRIFPKADTHTKWLVDAQPLDISEMLYSFIFGVDSQQISKQEVFKFTIIQNLTPVFIVLIALSIVLSINLLRSKNKTVNIISKLFLLSLLVTTAVCLFGINIFVPRYVMYLAIVFVVWISALVSQLNIKGYILAGLLYLVLLTQVVWVNTNTYFSSERLTELDNSLDDRRVVVKSPFDYLVLKYYLNNYRNLYFLDSNNWNMRNGPWLFFEKSQIILKTEKNDIII